MSCNSYKGHTAACSTFDQAIDAIVAPQIVVIAINRVPKQAPSRRLIESSSLKTWYGTDLAEQYGAHGLKAMGVDRLLMVRSYRGDERHLFAVSRTRVLGGNKGAKGTLALAPLIMLRCGTLCCSPSCPSSALPRPAEPTSLTHTANPHPQLREVDLLAQLRSKLGHEARDPSAAFHNTFSTSSYSQARSRSLHQDMMSIADQRVSLSSAANTQDAAAANQHPEEPTIVTSFRERMLAARRWLISSGNEDTELIVQFVYVDIEEVDLPNAPPLAPPLMPGQVAPPNPPTMPPARPPRPPRPPPKSPVDYASLAAALGKR